MPRRKTVPPSRSERCESSPCWSPRCWRRSPRVRRGDARLRSSHREAPLHVARPDRRRHRRLRVHGERRPRRADGRRELDPVRGSGRRPELLPVRRPRRSTTSTSTTPATASTTSATSSSFKTTIRNKNSFLYALPGVELDQRPEAQRRTDLRRHARDATSNGQAAHRPSGSPRSLPVAPEQRRARRPSPTTTRVANAGDPLAARRRQGVRRARSTIRSSSTWAPRSTRSTSATAPATPAAARTTWRATTSTRSPSRSPSRDGDQGPQGRLRPDGRERRRRRVVLAPTAAPVTSCAGTSARRATPRGPGQPPGQPAGQRGRHPAGQEGLLQRARSRPNDAASTSASTSSTPELAQGHQRPVPGPQRPGDQPDGHRPGAAHRASRA